MKKHIYLVLAIIATLCLSMFFVACGPEKEEQNPDTSINVDINKSSVNMILGFTDNLKVVYDKTEGYSLTWSSSDDSIVSVKDGKLEALKQGTATITATYSNGTNSYSDTATVNVGLDGNVPVLCIENNIDESTWNILKGDSIEFVPYVYFMGVKFYDVDVTASIGNDSVISYSNNTITALGKGATNITIEGSWKGIDFNNKNAMSVSFDVNVLNNYQMYLNNGAVPATIDLYTRESWGGKTYNTSMPFTLSVTEQDVLSDKPIDISIANENVVSYNNGVLSQVAYGETEIALSWTSDSGDNVSKLINVRVQRPSTEFEKELEYFSAIDGVALYDIDNDGKVEETTLAQVFFGENTDKVILDGTQTYYNIATKSIIEDDVLTISDNTVNGVYTHNSGAMDVVLSLGTSTEIYVVNVKTYAKVFAQDNVDEFLPTFSTGDANIGFNLYKDAGVVEKYQYYFYYSSTWRHQGYYILCEDLDMTGIICTTSYSPEFAGTFDGAGHVISNLSFAGGTKTAAAGGIFGRLRTVLDLSNTGASINNVAFTNVNFNSSYCTVLGYYARGTSDAHAKVNNVYIQVNKQSTFQNHCCPAFYTTDYVDFTNVVIDYQVEDTYDASSVAGPRYGSFNTFMKYTGKKDQIVKDVFVISTLQLVYSPANIEDFPLHYSQDAENTAVSGVTAVKGAYRYNTIDAMKSANNTYSTFSADYWTIKDGIPVWKALA